MMEQMVLSSSLVDICRGHSGKDVMNRKGVWKSGIIILSCRSLSYIFRNHVCLLLKAASLFQYAPAFNA